jgi:hypothetical protein
MIVQAVSILLLVLVQMVAGNSCRDEHISAKGDILFQKGWIPQSASAVFPHGERLSWSPVEPTHLHLDITMARAQESWRQEHPSTLVGVSHRSGRPDEEVNVARGARSNLQMNKADDTGHEDSDPRENTQWWKQGDRPEVSRQSSEGRNGVGIDSDTSPTEELDEQCWKIDYAYGAASEGACSSATLVALHCKESCLESVHQEEWFPQGLPTRRVEYSSAARCQKACLNTEACKFWVFDTRPGTFEKACWLKQPIYCDRPFADVAGFISGPAKCASESVDTRDAFSSRRSFSKTKTVNSNIAVPKEIRSKDKNSPKQQQTSLSQWVPWILHLLLIFFEMLGGGVCLAGIVGCVYWKWHYTKDLQDSNRSSPLAEQPPPRYQRPSTSKEATQTSKKLSETLRGYDVPASSGSLQQPEPEEEATFDIRTPRAEQQAREAAYDY